MLKGRTHIKFITPKLIVLATLKREFLVRDITQ